MSDAARMRMGGGHFLAVPLLVVSLGTSALALEPLETHMTPPGQPPLESITANDLTPVKAIFNRDSDRPRALILLSPT